MLFRSQEKKGRFIPQTILPQHGITGNCGHSPFSMEVWNDTTQQYISSSSYAKISSSRESQEEWEKDFESILESKYSFTNEIDQLGQRKNEDSYIAIVHCDGNDMGKKFQDTKTLEETRKLSYEIQIALKKSFANLLRHIIQKFSDIQKALGYHENNLHTYPKEGNKQIGRPHV